METSFDILRERIVFSNTTGGPSEGEVEGGWRCHRRRHVLLSFPFGVGLSSPPFASAIGIVPGMQVII